MSNLHNSNWNVSGNRVTLSIPFAKVDHEKRLVSGFATLNNIDSQGDVVLAESSAKAFARAHGNLREMHQPIAAGHLVDFTEDQFFDSESGNIYRGIFVTAYVSKGAESTWEKVLDGTLTGFSIGGEIKEQETQFVEDAGRAVRFIKDYELVELSLVDNPANPLANIFSIQKSADGSVTKVNGMIADTKIENVFYCGKDKIARTMDAVSANCLICGDDMENIGWVEVGSDQVDKVREVVSRYTGGGLAASDASSANTEMVGRETTHKNIEGGVIVEDNNNNTESQETVEKSLVLEEEVQETVDEVEATEAVDEASEVVEDVVVEDVAAIDEVVTESDELQKKMEALVSTINDTLTKSLETNEALVSALENKFEEFTKSMDSKISELGEKLTEFDKELATAKGSVSEFEKNLETYNTGGAIKKSGEVVTIKPEKVQKDDDWNGAFSIRDIFGRS